MNSDIYTNIVDGIDINSVYDSSPVSINSILGESIQLQTIVEENGVSITSVVNAPWVSVTSVNGMTGDVETRALIPVFKPNTYYLEDEAVSYGKGIYVAKYNFTSESVFDENDWVKVSSGEGDDIFAYDRIEKIKPYLYETWYSDLDYKYSKEFFESRRPTLSVGGCTTIRKEQFLGRNLDWTYDESVNFLVHAPRTNGRYASIAVAGAISSMTEQFVNSGEYTDMYKLVPFFTQDGMNEFGLCVSTNVVPNQHGDNSDIVPTGEVKDTICTIMFPRYILDNYQSAEEAITDVQAHLEMFTPQTLLDMGYEQHFMVADNEKTYIVEFNEGGYVVIEGDYMTNFYLADVEFNVDGTVNTPASVPDGHLPSDNNITSYGMGLERYNLVVDRYDGISDENDFLELLKDLYYTKTYSTAPVVSDPFWFTECVGGDLTVDNTPADFSHIVEVMGGMYSRRTRNGETWQTVHSSLYDMKNRKLYLMVQEEDTASEYVLEFMYTADEVDNLLEGKVDKAEGKGLSSNDFTDALKDKLDDIEDGAEANVKTDWNEQDSSKDSYLDNKPSNIVYSDSSVASSGSVKQLRDENGNAMFPALLKSQIVDILYPVGSIYMSATMATVEAVEAQFGGEWVAWGSGRVPVGVDTSQTEFNTVGKTGGGKTHRHDFKIGLTQYYGAVVGDNLDGWGAFKYSTNSYPTSTSNDGLVSISRNSGALDSMIQNWNERIRGSTGDTDLGSSLQPYITCYMFKRIS